ncbi:host specificity protein, partial [Vibrio agarivorans]
YARVDTGARVEPPPVSVLPTGAVEPPANVVVSEYQTVDQGINVTAMRTEWEAVEGAIAYEAEWRRDDGPWVNVPRTSALGFDVLGIYAGRYVARVRAVNAMDVKSPYGTSLETTLHGKTTPPPVPAFLTATSLVFGIQLDWGFPQGATDTLKTEVQYSTTNSASGMAPLGDFTYPTDTTTLMGLAAGQVLYFRARLVDKSGNIG